MVVRDKVESSNEHEHLVEFIRSNIGIIHKCCCHIVVEGCDGLPLVLLVGALNGTGGDVIELP